MYSQQRSVCTLTFKGVHVSSSIMNIILWCVSEVNSNIVMSYIACIHQRETRLTSKWHHHKEVTLQCYLPAHHTVTGSPFWVVFWAFTGYRSEVNNGNTADTDTTDILFLAGFTVQVTTQVHVFLLNVSNQ